MTRVEERIRAGTDDNFVTKSVLSTNSLGIVTLSLFEDRIKSLAINTEGHLWFGNDNTVIGDSYNGAFGSHNTVNSLNSYAFGSENTVSGKNAFVAGYSSTVKSDYGYSQNEGTIASARSQTVIGTYNLEDDYIGTTHPSGTLDYKKYAFIIGNGTKTNSSNAFTVQWNGDTKIFGDLSVAGLGNLNTLTVRGESNLNKLTVTGESNLNKLTVTGDSSLSTLTVTGESTLDTLKVMKWGTFDGLTVKTNFESQGDTTFSGDHIYSSDNTELNLLSGGIIGSPDLVLNIRGKNLNLEGTVLFKDLNPAITTNYNILDPKNTVTANSWAGYRILDKNNYRMSYFGTQVYNDGGIGTGLWVYNSNGDGTYNSSNSSIVLKKSKETNAQAELQFSNIKTPQILVNLNSEAAADGFGLTPRPGVTGILPRVHGGTGITNIGQIYATGDGNGDNTDYDYTDNTWLAKDRLPEGGGERLHYILRTPPGRGIIIGHCHFLNQGAANGMVEMCLTKVNGNTPVVEPASWTISGSEPNITAEGVGRLHDKRFCQKNKWVVLRTTAFEENDTEQIWQLWVRSTEKGKIQSSYITYMPIASY